MLEDLRPMERWNLRNLVAVAYTLGHLGNLKLGKIDPVDLCILGVRVDHNLVFAIAPVVEAAEVVLALLVQAHHLLFG